MATELFANNFAVQLASGCAPTDTTITVTAPAPTALQGAGQFRILIDQEYMLVTGGASGTSWAVTRGAGTGESPTPTAVSHGRGAWVTHLITAAAISNLGPGGGGAGNTVTSEVGLGNTGSAQTVSLASTTNQIVLVTGTLTANCTITISNRAAGCQIILLLVQDGTGGRTLNISDGSSSAAVTINSPPGTFSGVLLDCPNSTDIYVNSLSLPGPPGVTGPTGATGATGPSGAGFGNVVAKTANYTIASGDNSIVFTFNGSSLTATLPATAPAQPWAVTIINLNASSLTVSPNGKTLNGSASSITIAQNQSIFVWSDGTNYEYGTGPAGPVGPAGGALTFTAKSANYTAVSGDFVQMTGAHTVTLPSPTAGLTVGVISVNGTGTSPCTISTPSGAILGKGVAASATSILLGTSGANVTLEADGTNWNIIAGCQDSGWLTPGSFTNSWVNGSPSVQYRLIENRVIFTGQMASGSAGATAFTLPAGYRPTVATIYPTLKYNSGAPQTDSATIQTSGAFQPNATDATAYYPAGAAFTVD